MRIVLGSEPDSIQAGGSGSSKRTLYLGTPSFHPAKVPAESIGMFSIKPCQFTALACRRFKIRKDEALAIRNHLGYHALHSATLWAQNLPESPWRNLLRRTAVQRDPQAADGNRVCPTNHGFCRS